ncbi:glycosyltransferase family 2 protein [Desulfobacterales bacterium HSG2]|nr:glycosyltransferase family 2 protein [Desulfobacterales bacterium HSG2]
MPNISVTIISANEAHNIKDCLESVRWADEIVLVDHFSTDGTAKIAKDFGVRVFQEPWRGFAVQKNSAIDKAEGLWILSLDADERVTPPLRQEIEETIHRKSAYNGYYIGRKNFFCNQWIRHGGWYPDRNLRLFRKNAGCFQERAVHERVLVEGETGYLRHPMEHYTYTSVADYLKRLERYSRLAALEISDRKRWTRWHTLTLRPLFTFVNMYLLRRGILDGTAGLFLAVSYAYYTFLKYYRFYEEKLDA